jgi:hypothetical protein
LSIRPIAPGRASRATTASPGGAGRSGAVDAVGIRPSPDRLREAALRGAAGPGVALLDTPAAAEAIAAGEHQIRVVGGRTLTYPSQDLARIESLRPDQPGQTHAINRHVGTTLADNVARLTASPLLRAAGSYSSLADAQFATDATIANPANQAAIGAFLADGGRLKIALARVDLGRNVGTTTFQRDVAAGTPSLVPGSTATVVLIKDPTFPEGYRILTTYPDTGRPEADARGNHIA